jgi:choline dehydrogenase-like flavoprotein
MHDRIIADRRIRPETAPLNLPQSHGIQERNRVRGVKRNVATNPAIFGETHFGLTAPTTIWGISACSHPEQSGRSGAVCSTPSCRGCAFGLGSFKNRQIGALEDTPGLSAGTWQMRPLSRGYVEAKSNRPNEAPAINSRYLSQEPDRRATTGGL